MKLAELQPRWGAPISVHRNRYPSNRLLGLSVLTGQLPTYHLVVQQMTLKASSLVHPKVEAHMCWHGSPLCT